MYADVISHFVHPFSRKYKQNHLKMHQDNATTHYGMAKNILEQIGVQWVNILIFAIKIFNIVN